MASNVDIVIKRPKKGGHEAHHGGAWKVAYADFVTAMMAFFLLLWLLNATTEEQKRGISDYFAPSSVSQSPSGAGSILGGRAISAPGAMTSGTSSPSVSVPLSPSEGKSDFESKGDDAAATDPGRERDRDITEEEAREVLAKREEEQFKEAEAELREAIAKAPDLQSIQENLLIDRTPEGLRIQIVDQEGKPMFPLGSARIDERLQALMGKIASVVEKLPNRISVTGHTDALQFRGSRQGYGTWELSSDRALASRRALISGGMPTERVAMVVGRAAEEPLVPEEPNDARNRRISIVVLRQANDKPKGQGAAQFRQDWTGPRVR
jgi:chemotaxis protein MotB